MGIKQQHNFAKSAYHDSQMCGCESQPVSLHGGAKSREFRPQYKGVEALRGHEVKNRSVLSKQKYQHVTRWLPLDVCILLCHLPYPSIKTLFAKIALRGRMFTYLDIVQFHADTSTRLHCACNSQSGSWQAGGTHDVAHAA